MIPDLNTLKNNLIPDVNTFKNNLILTAGFLSFLDVFCYTPYNYSSLIKYFFILAALFILVQEYVLYYLPKFSNEHYTPFSYPKNDSDVEYDIVYESDATVDATEPRKLDSTSSDIRTKLKTEIPTTISRTRRIKLNNEKLKHKQNRSGKIEI
jgi:hypothetical protein